MTPIDSKYGTSLHIRNSKKEVINLPTLNAKEYKEDWCAHKVNILVERPDVTTADASIHKTVNNKIFEHRFVPLLQDSLEHSFLLRFNKKEIYGIDPIRELEKYCIKARRMHLVNIDGVMGDRAGNATTAVSGTISLPKDRTSGIIIGANSFVKVTNGSTIFGYLDDFTILADVEFLNAATTRRMILASANGISFGIESTMATLYVSLGGEEKTIELPKALELKKEYRIILQRKNGVVDVWVSGIHVGNGLVMSKALAAPATYYLGANTDEKSGWLDGSIHDIVLWSKAILDSISIVYDLSSKTDMVEDHLKDGTKKLYTFADYTLEQQKKAVIGVCIDHMGDPKNGFKQIDYCGNELTQPALNRLGGSNQTQQS